MEFLLVIFILIACIFLYFLPTIIAEKRKHNSWGAIFVLNLLLGWTFLFWAICLVWALTNSSNIQVNNVEKSSAEEIKKLAELKEAGIITEKEFNNKKKQILKN